MKRVIHALCGLACLGFAACATATPPKELHVESRTAVSAAEQMVATADAPEAELYLSKAQEHIAFGEKLMEQGEFEGARLHFERANAAAETAMAVSRAAVAKTEAAAAERRLNELRGG